MLNCTMILFQNMSDKFVFKINIVFRELFSLKFKYCVFENVFFIKCRIRTSHFDTIYDKFNVDNESEIFGDKQNRCGKGSERLEYNSNLIKLIGNKNNLLLKYFFQFWMVSSFFRFKIMIAKMFHYITL